LSIKENWIAFIHQLQDDICAALESADGKAMFKEDQWERAEGGGGKTRIIANGNVIEKGGVNTSIVFGTVTNQMRAQLKLPTLQNSIVTNNAQSEVPPSGGQGVSWFAAGLSLVIHPSNPFVPTVHCNYRMFELYDENEQVVDRWFGGGTDLTPYYLFEEDAKHFHQAYKDACDKSDASFYPAFKKQCDDYFVNTHRNNERRGIGGIFYDYKKPNGQQDDEFWMNLAKNCGYAFMDAYIPIVNKRKETPYSEANKYWQEIRRGRYTEFNLVHDRGTTFGLKTNGRTESILMSLPPTVRFDYNSTPEPGSEEDQLLQACLHPKDWLGLEITDEERNEWASKTNSC
jgi:coproporphyrinogen III oxidase